MKISSYKSKESFMYITIFKKIRINLFILPIFYSAYRFGFLELILLSYLTAIMHECFHIIAMSFFRIPFKKIDIQPFGVCAYINNVSIFNSYKEALIALSGPFFNFCSACILMCLKNVISYDFLDYAIQINLFMGLFNLIPALPLDGGRVLRAVLSMHFGIIKSYNFMITLSRKIIFLILFSGILILLFTPFNFSLILISAFLLSNIANEEKSLNQVILKDILKAKEQIINNPLNTKVITVSEDTPARCILKLLTFDYCLEFSVLNKNGKIINRVSESEVLTLLLNNGIRSAFSDFCQNKKEEVF